MPFRQPTCFFRLLFEEVADPRRDPSADIRRGITIEDRRLTRAALISIGVVVVGVVDVGGLEVDTIF